MKNLTHWMVALCLMGIGCQQSNDKIVTKPKEHVESADGTVPQPNDCPTQIICTENFAAITVQVVDAKGKPVLLDSFRCIKTADGENLIDHVENVMQRPSEGVYPVAGDNNLSMLRPKGDEVEFFGFLNGKVVAQGKFTIGHDCCHVQKIAGDSVLVVQ